MEVKVFVAIITIKNGDDNVQTSSLVGNSMNDITNKVKLLKINFINENFDKECDFSISCGHEKEIVRSLTNHDVYFISHIEEHKLYTDSVGSGSPCTEWCGECEEQTSITPSFEVQKCTECGEFIVPCSLCPLNECIANCPLEKKCEELKKAKKLLDEFNKVN